jgi:AcrR family transcriptional regulator
MSTLQCEYFHMSNRPIRKAAGQYHHGELRSSLIAAGLQLIEKNGVRALTLREIGSRVGVSRMAAYRHFRDKEDMLAAIREAGFELFADTLEESRNKAGRSFPARLSAMGVAYVRFAAEHPAYYEVMFSWQDQRQKPAPQAVRAFGILEETIREGQERGEVIGGDSRHLAWIVWSQVHGISMLRLAQDLSSKGEGTRFVEFSCKVLLTGVQNKD